MPLFGLEYEREMTLVRRDPPSNHGTVSPITSAPRAAFSGNPRRAHRGGRCHRCPARRAPDRGSGLVAPSYAGTFHWPRIEGQRADVIPAADGTVDFYYLYDLTEGRMAWRRPGEGLYFEYDFDPAGFRFAWLFASYGGFDGHYTAVLEPSTAMPISVNQAAPLGQCTLLAPGESLVTRVVIRAGRLA
jgi:hypothetical protein